ncbi:hypothetical protein ACLESD_15270 [Pyxidicoccus sp. 3LFB2]
MKTKNLLKVSVVGALLAGTAAWAGLKSTHYVTINTSAREAFGSYADARGSGDRTQAIGCSIHGFSRGSSTVICQAQDASGFSVYCLSSDPALVTAATSQSDAAYIRFTYDDNGACTYLYVGNSSNFAPRQP